MGYKSKLLLKDQTGTALIISMIMVIILSLIGLASIFTSTFEVKLSGNKRGSTNAFYTTEAGIEAVLVYTANFNSTNTTNFKPAGTLPSYLSNESIDTKFSTPTIGITFADAPTVAIYHMTDTRCEAGTSATLETFECERFIVDSTGRDQADISISRSRTHIVEKLVNHLPK
jgi:type IV pilus assembly protein PilX